MARIVIEDPDWRQRIVGEGNFEVAVVMAFVMGSCYQFAGDPVRALDSYELLLRPWDKDLVFIKYFLQPMALDQRGCLGEAELCARIALAHPDNVAAGEVYWSMVALGWVLLHRGLSDEGAAWLGDYRVKFHSSFGYLSLYELGWAAVRRGDVLTAQTFADRLDSLASAREPDAHLRVCAALLHGVVLGQSGDEDRAGELFNGALVDARQAGLGELESVALTQLAEWHLRGHRLVEAHAHGWDALELAERAELRLRCADALNVLSRVERAAGKTGAAAETAYHQAWCDGPPFSYAAGLDEARANLSAVGALEPAGLESLELGELFPEVLIKPTPRPEPT